MSWMAVDYVRENQEVEGCAKAVFMAIALRANDEKGHTCYPGITLLSRDTGLGERTVKRAIRSLVKQEELRILKRGGYRGGVGFANEYQVTFKGPERPTAKGPERPIGESLQAAVSPLRAAVTPGNGPDSPLQGAALTPQSTVKPQVVKPKEEAKEPPLPPRGGNALSPQFQDYMKKVTRWNNDEEPENSGKVEKDFLSRLEQGYSVEELVSAFRGASALGDTDLADVLAVDRIENYRKHDPMSVGWKKAVA